MTPGSRASPTSVILIGGPTSAGKTRLAIEVAERLGGEVISADSQQVYRGFDIGTGKPAPDQLARVPHHLISYLDPATEQTDAADFERRASGLVAEIEARGKVPLVVGGTGLYLRALLFGVVDAPPRNPDLRRTLEERALVEGRPKLHAELVEKDPVAAARIQPNDLVRIIRALEIQATTGRRASDLRGAHGFSSPRYRAAAFLLEPPRDELYLRIDRRVAEMFEGGLLDEVQGLVGRGLRESAPMRSLGYSQALEVLAGTSTLQQAMEATARATRHYAKRQGTWFRKEPWWKRLPAPSVEPLLKEVEEFLASAAR